MAATPAAHEGATVSDGGTRRPSRKRAGRPPAITRKAVDEFGQVWTVGEQVCAYLRDGLPIDDIAALVGINPTTIYRAQGEGHAVESLILEGRLDPGKLTRYQTAALGFCKAIRQAKADAVELRLRALSVLAEGGHVKRRTVTTYEITPSGERKAIGETVQEDVLPPDRAAAQVWLERRRPDLFGKVERIEHALGAEGPTVQTASPKEKLREALEAIERRKAQASAVIPVDEIEEQTA